MLHVEIAMQLCAFVVIGVQIGGLMVELSGLIAKRIFMLVNTIGYDHVTS